MLHCFETQAQRIAFTLPNTGTAHASPLMFLKDTLCPKVNETETNIKRREQRYDENNITELGQESILAGHHRSILQML